MSICAGEYIHWIYKVFGECVTTQREKMCFGFGISSTLIWMWAQLPQIYMNFRSKHVDGLSLGFLLLLVLGDISNLTGCILTHGLVTQKITSTFFCIVDITCTLQYLYYKFVYPKCCQQKPEISIISSENDGGYTQIIPGIATIAAAAVATLGTEYENPYSKKYLAGSLIGWISGVIYSSSRVFQIIKNFMRKRTDGLSIQFFISAWLGNCTYAISIFLKDSHWGYIWMQFPWLVGSMGPMILDLIVLTQFFLYRKQSYFNDQALLSKE